MNHVGGYLFIPQPFVKSGIHKHTTATCAAARTADEDPISDTMLEAVNTLQRTPWRVNTFILDVMDAALRNGDHIGNLPAREDTPLPARLDEGEWDKMEPTERMTYKLQLSTIHGENARRAGRWASVYRKVALAKELADEPGIWFPHALDFRGRVYPQPQDLNPQCDDIGKSLLMFAQGKPIGERGIMWLEIALANAGGQDKLSLEDRVAWTRSNAELIFDSALNPLDGERFWCDETVASEDPWQFLALAKEYLGSNLGGPEYVSRIPINMDGSCNGLQHLSALGLDETGAKATNLLDLPDRQDCYEQVAEATRQLVLADFQAGIEEAAAWSGHVTRKTVKRAVMTTPYGVTHRGIRDQLIADRLVDDLEGDKMRLANYMTAKIRAALETTVSSAKVIMSYFQDTAGALAEQNMPMSWVTPAGMVVTQSYWKLAGVQVETLYGKVHLYNEVEDTGLDKRKQQLAAAPNVIHSFDAAHLARTVCYLNDIGEQLSYSFIHDSYGTHACDVDLLAQALRDEFVDIYSVDRLEEFDENMRAAAPGVELPDRPERGTLDLEQVRHSKYFFS